MPTAPSANHATPWNVHPYDPIEHLGPNLWRVEGELPNMGLRRVMTVARRSDGDLVIHNAMALEEADMAALEAWGRPAWIVVPNRWHRLDAPAFKARYPEARVICPRGATKAVAKKVAVDGDLSAYPSDDEIALVHLDGTKEREGVMLVRSPDGAATLVFNDILFNMPKLPGFEGLFMHHVTCSSGGPKVSRVGRLFLMSDRRALQAAFERLAATPGLARIIVSHHEVISERPAEVLRAVAAAL